MKERFSHFSQFPGREITTKISKPEKQFYLEKLRAAAKAGDSVAMAKIVELGTRAIIPEDLVEVEINGKTESLYTR